MVQGMSLPSPKKLVQGAVRKVAGIKQPKAPAAAAAPAVPDPAKTAPTIDYAAQQAEQNMQRLRRRRGVMANIFAGRQTLG
jgi:hypothetical protein